MSFQKAIRTAGHYFLLLMLLTLIGCALLYLAGLDLPSGVLQERIDYKIELSSELLMEETDYPTVFSLRKKGATMESTVLDNYTESIMLNSSKYMNTVRDPLSILSNPRYITGQEIAALDLSMSAGEEANTVYHRYWQGFRVFLRPMLWVMDYASIREFLRFVMLALFVLTSMDIAQKAGGQIAVPFALSIAFVSFAIVSTQLQYAICFAIMMLSMLVVPRWKRSLPEWFFIVGVLTQYFDFYTVPCLTLSMPLIYLLYLDSRKTGSEKPLRRILTCTFAWFCGYLGIWLVKLILTIVFVDPTALTAMIGQITMWTGVNPAERMAEITRLDAVRVLFTTSLSKAHLIVMAALAALAAAGMIRARVKQLPLKPFWQCLPVIAIPLVWVLVAYKATVWHTCFQYRNACVIFFSLFCFAASLMVPYQKTE